MVKFNLALILLMVSSNTKPSNAFLSYSTTTGSVSVTPSYEKSASTLPSLFTSTSRHVSVSSAFDQPDPLRENDDQNIKLLEAVGTLSESLTDAILRDEALDAQDESLLEFRKQRLLERLSPNGWLASMSFAGKMGITLAQMEQGRHFAAQALDFDTLTYRSTEAMVHIDKLVVKEGLMDDFRGLVVLCVEPDSQGWTNGVRPGDVLVATSATIGDGMWPKKSLEGVRAALTSRKLSSSQVALLFQRTCADATAIDNMYELTLSRPLGLEIEEDSAGYVFVSGFNENASKLALNGVQIGDRILAIGSSVGGNMWPVSTVEGVVSACTARLPGQKVTMRFERPLKNMKSLENEVNVGVSELIIDSTPVVLLAHEQVVSQLSPTQHKVLLQRCREVLKRYWSSSKTDFVGKNEIPVMVADKVVDAVASASASLDAVTLCMVMNAYLSCEQPDSAIRIFEAATGFLADGSVGVNDCMVSGKDKGTLLENRNAINLFTASSAMHAFAMKGDFSSAKRIVAAIEGKAGLYVDGKPVASWLGVGMNGSAQADTVCYNIALAAAASSENGMLDLLTLFSTMRDRVNTDKVPVKDIVSYNTVIAALDKAGRSDDAFAVFEAMRQSGIKPDKFTYTSLVKSCSTALDMQELLYDMKELGVKPDIVMFNTIIRTLCDRLQWYEAKKVVTQMESTGVIPNSMTYGFLMTGLLKAGKYSACLALFESACADPRTMALTESVHLYTTAISAAAFLKNHEKAFHLVNRMKAAGVRPNIKTLCALMTACLSSNMTGLAVQVFKQIEEPDAQSVCIGIDALCLEAMFADVSTILYQQWNSRVCVMSGKQIMKGYTTLIREALRQGNLEAARNAFRQFLKCGFIPSKIMYQSIIEGMSLLPPKARDLPFAKDIPPEHFQFLMFILDSIGERNLPCDGAFYALVLHCSSRMGGLYRKVGSLLAEARISLEGQAIGFKGSRADLADDSVGWENLICNYDDYKSSKEMRLPRLVVYVNKALVRQVLNAEKSVTHKNRRSMTQRKTNAQVFVQSKF